MSFLLVKGRPVRWQLCLRDPLLPHWNNLLPWEALSEALPCLELHKRTQRCRQCHLVGR
jgi:hypothetical protein